MPASVQVSGLDLALDVLKKYGDRELEKDMRRANMVGARIAARAIRAAAPVGPTSNLKSSVRARRVRPGYAGVIAGPLGGRGKGAHRHLVILGHQIVSHSKVASGRRSKANPFVDRAVDAVMPLIVEAVKRELYRE